MSMSDATYNGAKALLLRDLGNHPDALGKAIGWLNQRRDSLIDGDSSSVGVTAGLAQLMTGASLMSPVAARVTPAAATTPTSGRSSSADIADRVLTIRASQPGVSLAQAERQAREDVAYSKGESFVPTLREYAAMDPVTKDVFDKANGLTSAEAFNAFDFASDPDDEAAEEFSDDQLEDMLQQQRDKTAAKAEQKVEDARAAAVGALMRAQGIDWESASAQVAPLNAFRPAAPSADPKRDAWDKVTRQDMGLPEAE